MNIAFIGLGNMGSAMATNLIKAGHTLSVFNRTRSRAGALKPLGRASLARRAKPLPAPTLPGANLLQLAGNFLIAAVIVIPLHGRVPPVPILENRLFPKWSFLPSKFPVL